MRLLSLIAILSFASTVHATSSCRSGYGDDSGGNAGHDASKVVMLADVRKAKEIKSQDKILGVTVEGMRRYLKWLSDFSYAIAHTDTVDFKPIEWRGLFNNFNFIESNIRVVVTQSPVPEGTDAVERRVREIRQTIESSNLVEELELRGIWVRFDRRSSPPEQHELKLMRKLNEARVERQKTIAWVYAVQNVDPKADPESRRILVEMRLSTFMVDMLEHRIEKLIGLVNEIRDVRESNPHRRTLGESFLEDLLTYAEEPDIQSLIRAYQASSKPELIGLADQLTQSLNRLTLVARALTKGPSITIVK